MNLKRKESKRKDEKMKLRTRKYKDQIFFLLSVFPKESTFSVKESDVPIYFIILDVFGQEKKSPETIKK